ncbi:MAG TPA: PASTA domain-containing protein [Acidobacteriaceae bacterium]
MIRFFRAGMVTLILLLIATLSALITMRFAIHGAEVSVPDFKGMTLAAAAQRAATLGVSLSVEGRLYSTELPAGRVLTQSPAPGSVVRREWQVRVTESLGPQRVAIPDVVGQHERLASIAIRRLGLELGTITRMPDAQVPPGTVISQNPLPHAAGVERPSVSLLVADPQPDPPAAFLMPDYTGRPGTAAQADLTRAGLSAATVGHTPPAGNPAAQASTASPGTVVHQSPGPGERVTAQTPIVLDLAP